MHWTRKKIDLSIIFPCFNLADLLFKIAKLVKSDKCLVFMCSYIIGQRDLDGCTTLVTVYNFDKLLKFIHCATQIKNKNYEFKLPENTSLFLKINIYTILYIKIVLVKSFIYICEGAQNILINRLFSLLAIILRWGRWHSWRHQSTSYSPRFRSTNQDRKRGLGCRLMMSGTSPPQYGPHWRIIANNEKSLLAYIYQRNPKSS